MKKIIRSLVTLSCAVVMVQADVTCATAAASIHVPKAGILIGESRRSAHQTLNTLYHVHDPLPQGSLFRTSAYQYVDPYPTLFVPLRMVMQKSTMLQDSVMLVAQRADALVQQANIDIEYANGTVKKMKLEMSIIADVRELSPEDLINGPVIFPVSHHPEFLARGRAEPPTIDPNAATDFLYRTEYAQYYISQQVLQTLHRSSEPDRYVIKVTIECMARPHILSLGAFNGGERRQARGATRAMTAYGGPSLR